MTTKRTLSSPRPALILLKMSRSHSMCVKIPDSCRWWVFADSPASKILAVVPPFAAI